MTKKELIQLTATLYTCTRKPHVLPDLKHFIKLSSFKCTYFKQVSLVPFCIIFTFLSIFKAWNTSESTHQLNISIKIEYSHIFRNSVETAGCSHVDVQLPPLITGLYQNMYCTAAAKLHTAPVSTALTSTKTSGVRISLATSRTFENRELVGNFSWTQAWCLNAGESWGDQSFSALLSCVKFSMPTMQAPERMTQTRIVIHGLRPTTLPNLCTSEIEKTFLRHCQIDFIWNFKWTVDYARDTNSTSNIM